MTRRRKRIARFFRSIRRSKLPKIQPPPAISGTLPRIDGTVNPYSGGWKPVRKLTGCRSWAGLARARAMVDAVCRSVKFPDLTGLAAWAPELPLVGAVG
jgi:hypothetical protein